MSESIISVAELHKQYHRGIFRPGHVALRGITLDVAPGQVFGLLGPNGAGKTTLIKVLLGVIRRWKGRATVLGYRAGSSRARRRIGYLPENLRIPNHHTAVSALAYYGWLAGLPRAEIRRKSDELIARVGLQGRDRESVGRYSKGMLQRLGLAQALLHDPDLLILDEPTDGLDPVGRSQVRTVLKELSEAGKTIFLNSHILQEVELVCDRVAILSHGKIRGTGSVADLGAAMGEADHLRIDIRPPELSKEELDNVIAPLSGQTLASPDPQRMRLEFPIAHDEASDRFIDALRESGITIERVERRRPTLEEVFISIVGNHSGD